jgi:acyl carrier protein
VICLDEIKSLKENCIENSNDNLLRIEEVLKSHPIVQDALVVTENKSDGKEDIIAYLVCMPDKLRSNQLISGYLSNQLPGGILPSRYIWVDNPGGSLKDYIERSQQITQTGKKNEKVHYVLPKTETEKQIAEIWKRVLGVEMISVQDVFFEIGGDSLKCSQVFYLINQIYPDTVTLVDLFKYNTVEKLSFYIDQKLSVEKNTGKVDGYTL